MNLRMLREKRAKPFFVLRAHPCGEIGHDDDSILT
jgi:hypothetical protein